MSESTETTDESCRCAECVDIHSEFIATFGKWPTMSHAKGQEMAQHRLDNLASARRAGLL